MSKHNSGRKRDPFLIDVRSLSKSREFLKQIYTTANERQILCPVTLREVVCCGIHPDTKDSECNTLRSIYSRDGTGAIPHIRQCCSLFVCPIVVALQRQQNAAFHWPTARLLPEARTVTIALSCLSIQHKQIRVPIIFWFAEKRRWMGRDLDIGVNGIQIADTKWRNM